MVQATQLARKIASMCHQCKIKDKVTEKQLMGLLPPKRLRPLSPFEAMTLNLFGPFPMKDPAKGCRTFKCWVVAYICLAVNAVCLLPCPGYGTEDSMATHCWFLGIYGCPSLVYSDQAPSIIKAKNTQDWAQIADEIGAQGTDWKLTAKGCSWRNGLAE